MIIFGKQCFEYMLKNAPKMIEEVYVAKQVEKILFRKIAQLGVPIVRVDFKRAQALARGKNHQGILAKTADITFLSIRRILECNSLVVLCGLSDVGNIGSIIRTSYALGVGGVVLCDREVSNVAMEGIFRASSGAALSANLAKIDSLEFINQAKTHGFRLIGSGLSRGLSKDKNAESNLIKPKKWALFLGAEDVGLSKKILKKMDSIVCIEMKNNFDSLNVSVATGILIDRIL